MNVELAMLALNGISALSSSLQIYRHYSSERKDITVDQLDSLIQPNLATPESARHFAYIISDDLLGNVINNVKSARERLNNSVSSNKSHSGRLRDADEVARDICFELNYIKMHNQGVLPEIDSPNLYDLWLEHRCN